MEGEWTDPWLRADGEGDRSSERADGAGLTAAERGEPAARGLNLALKSLALSSGDCDRSPAWSPLLHPNPAQ